MSAVVWHKAQRIEFSQVQDFVTVWSVSIQHVSCQDSGYSDLNKLHHWREIAWLFGWHHKSTVKTRHALLMFKHIATLGFCWIFSLREMPTWWQFDSEMSTKPPSTQWCEENGWHFHLRYAFAVRVKITKFPFPYPLSPAARVMWHSLVYQLFFFFFNAAGLKSESAKSCQEWVSNLWPVSHCLSSVDGNENMPCMIITSDPCPEAWLAPQWPPGCPQSEVLTGSCLSADENIHGRVCLKGKRLADPSKITQSEAARLRSRECSGRIRILFIQTKKGTEGVASLYTMSSVGKNTVIHVSITLKNLW